MVSHVRGDLRAAILATTVRLRSELDRVPTPEEVRSALDIPRATLQYHVKILEAGGKIRRVYGGRGLEPVGNAE